MVKKEAPNSPDPHGLENIRTPSWIMPIHSRRWRAAKITPAAAVIIVQLKALERSPNFAARIAINIVRLLVMRMNVITIALITVGENLKGVGQFGVPLRKNP